ncbi:DUF488 family protein [Roseiterribacter gracilis]|uniref:DUF488 domain-containing protein n=1 Tax=Roseiterribacter gracilis TaxID=2812848 RepID=A0A8S8X757_9PROT|nr:hypothetical protein TMPK1_03310 [Rhodospirillales bacterium TMPK1]
MAGKLTGRGEGKLKDVRTICTIGYEGVTLPAVIGALRAANVSVLVDVRAVAASRRPGFAKSQLSAGLAEAGISYLHLRDLGTPAAGRAAAKAGRHAEMHRVFEQHLAGVEAQAALGELQKIVAGGTRACLLCLERDPSHCHRSLVVEALGERIKLDIQDLMPPLP